jgi:hypothetical protein
LSRPIKEKTYKTLVRPTLEYCSSIWDPSEKTSINKIERVQKTAARFMTNQPNRKDKPTSMTAILKDLRWESLQSRRKKSALLLLYKTSNNLVEIPEQYHPIVNHRHTRHTSCKFQTYQPNIEAYKQSFLPRTVPLWNSLPGDVAKSTTLDSFKLGLGGLAF